MQYTYQNRKTREDDWAIVHNRLVPAELLPLLHAGRTPRTEDGTEWRALPKLPTSAEIVTAAHRLSQELTRARKNGDWDHAATQLCIESAHDAFRALVTCGEPETIPPIVTDPKSRSRWKPRRCW